MKKITHEEFVKLLSKHNNNLIVLSEYKGMLEPIRVTDRDNIIYNVIARTLLQNEHPSITTAENKNLAFNIKLHKVFPDLTLISKYVTGNVKATIKDKSGIKYSVKLEGLLLGRRPSIITAINKTKAFVIMANYVHNHKYDYNLTKYKGDKTKVKIICKKHGVFEQRPNNHVNQKQGCLVCNLARGWNKTDWLNYTNGKKCTFYIIRCFLNGEIFIKFGITSSPIRRRFQSKCEMPYRYEIVKKYEGTGEEVWNIERLYTVKFKDFKYKPEVSFKGLNECYDISIINKLNL